jgi:uncharacterized protein YjbI with pentapeptide repeats
MDRATSNPSPLSSGAADGSGDRPTSSDLIITEYGTGLSVATITLNGVRVDLRRESLDGAPWRVAFNMRPGRRVRNLLKADFCNLRFVGSQTVFEHADLDEAVRLMHAVADKLLLYRRS